MPGRYRAAALAGLALALVAAPVPLAAAAGAKVAAKTGGKAAGKTRAKPRRGGAVAAPVVPLALPLLSPAADQIVAWVAAAKDNAGLPYAVIDKQAASLLLFDAKGAYLGQTPVLLGVGIGDDSSPGVGAKDLAEIGPAERTTPAGRFVTKFGRAFGRQSVLWVDYANSVAIHAVITTHKKERRVERLVSPSPEDNRISFGCINVGSKFYTGQLSLLFRRKGGVVYILPESRTLDDVFPRARLLPYLKPTPVAATPGAESEPT
nr:hypothetical protein [Sphingomonas aerolata]